MTRAHRKTEMRNIGESETERLGGRTWYPQTRGRKRKGQKRRKLRVRERRRNEGRQEWMVDWKGASEGGRTETKGQIHRMRLLILCFLLEHRSPIVQDLRLQSPTLRKLTRVCRGALKYFFSWISWGGLHISPSLFYESSCAQINVILVQECNVVVQNWA